MDREDLEGIRQYAKERQARDIDSVKLKTLCKFAIVLECKIEDILEDEECSKGVSRKERQ